MKINKKLLSVVCSVSILSSVGISYAISNFTEKDKVAIYQHLFDKDFAEGLFNDKPDMLEINGYKVGTYRANMKLLIEDVSLSKAFAKFTNSKEPMYSYERIAKYAGMNSFSKKREDTAFNYYNPEFLKWGINNLYINPKTEIYGVKAQEIYDKSFKDFFRLTAYSYLFLNKKKNYFKTEQKAYIDAYKASEKENLKEEPTFYFDGVIYLNERYGKLATKEFKAYSPEGFSYDVQTAIGFWLRRGEDKTDKIVWEGIKKVVSNYDKEWFKKNNK